MKRKWTEEKLARLLADRRKGATIRELAGKYGIAGPNLSRQLCRAEEQEARKEVERLRWLIVQMGLFVVQNLPTNTLSLSVQNGKIRKLIDRTISAVKVYPSTG
jgi:hypothetical protein